MDLRALFGNARAERSDLLDQFVRRGALGPDFGVTKSSAVFALVCLSWSSGPAGVPLPSHISDSGDWTSGSAAISLIAAVAAASIVPLSVCRTTKSSPYAHALAEALCSSTSGRRRCLALDVHAQLHVGGRDGGDDEDRQSDGVTTMGCFTTKRPHRTPLVTEVSEPSAWRIHGIFGLKVRLPAAPSSAGIRVSAVRGRRQEHRWPRRSPSG